jgi:hypothetical protein
MRWLLHPTPGNTWRFLRWYFCLGIVLHFLSLTGVALAGPAAQLTITPNPAVVGQVATASGCGYKPLVRTHVYLEWTAEPGHSWDDGYAFDTPSSSEGCVNFEFTPSIEGQYAIEIVQPDQNGRLRKVVYITFEAS